MQSLSDRTGDIEGLGAVIASFADGSAESVNAVAGMANATDEELEQMVANWQEVQKEQKATAESLADMQTGMSAVMDEWGAALAEDIEDMNLSDEAKKAGRATIQGYIDAAGEMTPQVQAAYEEMLRTAVSAIGLTLPERKAERLRNEEGALTDRGFAAGTSNAPPGWAWVGENGPELMFFNGGEKVLNAAQSSALQAEPVVSAIPAVPAADAGNGGGGSPSISLVVQVQGNATTETVDALGAKAQEIVAMVLDALDERAEDEKRCSMR